MIKSDETSLPNSCLNRALPNEMCFVLLGRDPAALVAIRAWIDERIRLGKNSYNDPQIKEAVNSLAIFQTQAMEWQNAKEKQTTRNIYSHKKEETNSHDDTTPH